MNNIEIVGAVAAVVTILTGIIFFMSSFRDFIIKICNLSKHTVFSLVKWFYRNDSIYQYRYLLKKKYPYYFKRLDELPREAQILYVRMYNAFRKRYSGKNIIILKDYNRSSYPMYFPISGLIKDLSIKDVDVFMQALKHSGFITDYYDQDELDKMDRRYGGYFCHLKYTSNTSLKKGIILVTPSQFGVKCFLSVYGCEVNTPYEKFCSAKIQDPEKLDIAENFFTEEDMKGFSG